MSASTAADDPTTPTVSSASGARALPPWWATLLVAVAITAVAFAIGRFSAFGVAPVSPGDSSPEAGFARDMQVHHAQAIDMAMTIYPKTSDDTLRALAYDIATAQSEQKGVLYGWLTQWGLTQLPPPGTSMMEWMTASDAGHDHGVGTGDAPLTDEEARIAMGMASESELTSLEDATGTQAECLFLDLMIRHHEGAIPMADAVLELGDDPTVLATAERMKAAQVFEIDAMQALQQRFSCSG